MEPSFFTLGIPIYLERITFGTVVELLIYLGHYGLILYSTRAIAIYRSVVITFVMRVHRASLMPIKIEWEFDDERTIFTVRL